MARTAEIALQAAETGHAVVATLHASSASQTVSRFLKLIPSDTRGNRPGHPGRLSAVDSLPAPPCWIRKNPKRFPIHEVLLQYDGVVNIIRRGEFKKLDQELETGWKRGMNNFDKERGVAGDGRLSQRCRRSRRASARRKCWTILSNSKRIPYEVIRCQGCADLCRLPARAG